MTAKQPATDNLVRFKNSQQEHARGTLVRLARNLVVFEVYNPYSIVQLSEVLEAVQIRRGDRVIYEGRAVVSNLVSTGLMLIVSATLVDPWSELVSLEPGEQLRQEVSSFIDDWKQRFESLSPHYQTAVGALRNFFEELSRWLNHCEAAAGLDEGRRTPDAEKNFIADVADRVDPKLAELCGKFEQEAAKVDPETLAVHKEYARRELHPLVLVSPFVHRTFTKPLGYAGDYEMVNMMFRDPWEGQNTYAKIVNSIIIKSDGARGHRNRISRLVAHLRGEAARLHARKQEMRVLNIGCGPAIEIERFIMEDPLSAHCHFDLIDFNEQTLQYASDRIDDAIYNSRHRPNVRMIHESIHGLLKRMSRGDSAQAVIGGSGEYDLVYCAGLFDYLSDRICSRLLKLFYQLTRPGGLMLATNVHPKNPVRQFIEHLLEWNLIYRDEAQMDSLCPDHWPAEVLTEQTGVNVFIEVRKPETEVTGDRQP